MTEAESANLKQQREEIWRVQLRNKIKSKDRTTIEKVKMPELPADIRNRNHDEVNKGLTDELLWR
jgi:glutamate synthase (NADPH) small chain